VRAIWTILKRELYAFFSSPTAYVVLTVWLIISGFGFFAIAMWLSPSAAGDSSSSADLVSSFFGGTTLFYLPLLVITPVFTMRLLAEEHSRGTIETLMTAPVSDTQIVVGKYLSALVVWITLWAPTLLYVWLGSRYGNIDLGATASSYLGILGIGAYYMAIGTLMSAIAKNQIVAAILTFLALTGLFMAGLGIYLFGEEYHEVFAYISIWGHMEAFSKGIIDTRYLVFDFSVAVLCVALAIGVLSTRRLET
jgi:ABC-2 type transport system permease protein